MSFSLWKKIELFRSWRLRSLADFTVIGRHMEIHRRSGHGEYAMRRYIYRMHLSIRQCVRQYEKCLRKISRMASDAALDDVVDELNRIMSRSAAIKTELDEALMLPSQSFVNHWNDVLDNSEKYIAFSNRVLRQFACPELVAIQLAGIGGIVTNEMLQKNLGIMSAIRTRIIRILELGRNCRASCRFDRRISGMVNPAANVKFIIETMIDEYLQQADPISFAARHARTRLSGRDGMKHLPVGYAAKPINDFLPGYPVIDRQCCGVVQIRPHLSPTPPVACDMQRIDWAIREVFINALLATHPLIVSRNGIARNNDLKDTPERSAVLIGLTSVKVPGASAGTVVKIMISDAGIGMTGEQLANAGAWGVSQRRSVLHENFSRLHAKRETKRNSLIIAGKGFGLAYAREIFIEHGGDLTVQSEFGRGTTVVMTLPAAGDGNLTGDSMKMPHA